jgi:uncharacterized protein YdiU (UPF0061 family)
MHDPAIEEPARTPSGPARWGHRLLTLGDRFHATASAEPLLHPQWVITSTTCAAELGLPLDWTGRPDWRSLDVMSGQALWPGMTPLATAYSGHRFGAWVGPLGDDGVLWLGETDGPNGPRELQLAGTGRTPYSRDGNGRTSLRQAIREFLAAEALHALGVPTTRGLCVVRGRSPGCDRGADSTAMLARAASSFLHVGHFEHCSGDGSGGEGALRDLADFVIDGYAPECRNARNAYAALLELVAWRTADLVAAWQSLGFCHGLMDTERMSILGLTMGQGSSAFLEAFEPGRAAHPADTARRYAWGRQPQAALWNLHVLAHAMTSLIGDEATARAALETYRARLPIALGERFAAKLGLARAEPQDAALVDDLLGLMASSRADFTLTFRRLAGFKPRARSRNAALRDLFVDRAGFDAWARRYAERLAGEETSDAERAARMNQVNPKFVLRDHLVDEAIQAAAEGDCSAVQRLHALLERPFEEQPESASYAEPRPCEAEHMEASCSS